MGPAIRSVTSRLLKIRFTILAGHPPFVLTVSGSDASGGSGLQADNRAILNRGGFPLNVVTALTLQTPTGVQSIDTCDPEQVRLHLSGLLKSYPVKSIKTGMLGNGGMVKVVTEVISQFRQIPLVVDPVMRSTSGCSLLDEDGIRELKNELLPICDLVTPNLTELTELTGRDSILSGSDESDAARQLLETGCGAVLVKGGHRKGDSVSDMLYSRDGKQEFPGQRVDTPNTRGTGCSLASAIAAGLAGGRDLQTAIERAKSMVQNSLELHKDDLWPGSGPAL